MNVQAAQAPTFAELFTPKIVTVFREGYRLEHLRADAIAGLTVAIVALPLSMAIAIASGVSPERGLYTAIIGGFIVSLLGGSRFQIGGPAGAFIVLVAATVATHGVDGLILATFLSGVVLAIAGYLRLGTYVKFIPYPVTVGFTAAIGAIIFASQIHDLFGLTLSGPEPGPLFEKLEALWAAWPTFTPGALAIAVMTIAIIQGLRVWRPGWPGMLVAVAAASIVVYLSGMPVETIGTRFGGIPRTLPMPALPDFSLDKIIAVAPNALSFALLGAIESLLSAVVADGMSGRRHRSNCELAAQGFANMGSALFGGFCVTGTIARTATNVRAHAHGPVSGMLHSAFILAFMLLAAPLAAYIPLACLAGVLALVAWNMIEKHAIAQIVSASRGDALVLGATFIVTLTRDLMEGIITGFVIGAFLFIDRMGKAVAVEAAPLRDVADTAPRGDDFENVDPQTVVYRISGAFFFGAAAAVGTVLDRISDRHRNFILDCSAVPLLDSTAANVLEGAVRKAEKKGTRIAIAGASVQARRMLVAHGVKPPRVVFATDVAEAQAALDGEVAA
ncbi:MAG: SulP family inorganic anion transporter [Nitratireductor sp.]|nr:SulP family inorganic anion transporter [Nitratireductor sp.]